MKSIFMMICIANLSMLFIGIRYASRNKHGGFAQGFSLVVPKYSIPLFFILNIFVIICNIFRRFQQYEICFFLGGGMRII